MEKTGIEETTVKVGINGRR